MAGNISKEDVIEYIAGMTVLELSDLVKDLEKKFGVSAAAPVAAVAAAPVAQAQEQVAEKTEFDVILVSSGDKKIQVIKEVRAHEPRSQRGQSVGGRCAWQSEGGGLQRGGREHQGKAGRGRCDRRSEIRGKGSADFC
jgi:hypothetical protein